MSRLLSIYRDSLAAIYFSKNNKSASRNKRIDIKYLMVREKVKVQDVSIKHISTELMIADPMSKALLAKVYNDHLDHMGLIRSLNV